MAGIRIGRPGGLGRPRTRPDGVLADKAYSTRKIRKHLRRRRITATIPEPSDRIKNRRAKGSKGGRPPAFDPETYKLRNTVERAFNRLRGFRAVARYDKRDFVYRGTIDAASIKIWLRDPVNQSRDTALVALPVWWGRVRASAPPIGILRWSALRGIVT